MKHFSELPEESVLPIHCYCGTCYTFAGSVCVCLTALVKSTSWKFSLQFVFNKSSNRVENAHKSTAIPTVTDDFLFFCQQSPTQRIRWSSETAHCRWWFRSVWMRCQCASGCLGQHTCPSLFYLKTWIQCTRLILCSARGLFHMKVVLSRSCLSMSVSCCYM